jgi:hypothetical protein
MATEDGHLKSIPVENYAADVGMLASELVSLILDGKWPAERREDRWYIAAPLVQLVHPDDSDDTGLLKIAACRLGCYVTAGRGELGIPLRFADPGRPAALVALNAALSKETSPELPVEIHLNGEHLLIDSSLWVDLGAALVEYETLMDPSIEDST